jgi:glycosyltransferase involved in cell wall biosynthesis
VKKLTILHTIETAGPGGAETVVLDLASGLDSKRFRSVALVPREDWLPKQLRDRGVPTFLIDSKAWFDFRLPAGMARLILREKVDLIHSHLSGQNFYSCIVGRLTGSKTIATYHGAIDLSQCSGLRGTIRLASVKWLADAVVAVCDHVGEMLRHAGFPAEKVIRIYNGIDVDRFQTRGDGRLRRELGLGSGTKLVGTVANVRQGKGYEFFIRAARTVADAGRDTHFVAVGDVDTALGKPLFGLIEQLGLQERFHFLGFRSDVPEILSELDIFVLPSVSEGFPLVALEAMASARPVVVTRSGGPQEVVENGQTGLLVPPADPEAIAAKVCELLSQPERAAGLARSARARVENTFTVQGMINQYEELYERVMGLA